MMLSLLLLLQRRCAAKHFSKKWEGMAGNVSYASEDAMQVNTISPLCIMSLSSAPMSRGKEN
jgi:hypothetical protein